MCHRRDGNAPAVDRRLGGGHVDKRRGRLAGLASFVAIGALAIAACSGGGGGGSGGGTMNIAINPWVGYEANAAVVGYLAKNQLNATVNEKVLKEEVSWQGFANGDVDVIIENWGHPDLMKKYVEEDKTAVNAGPTGNQGIIGWYVPPWLAEEHPEVLDWNNLNDFADEFKTSESGDQGQFLAGDPSFVTNDEALIKNLDLNFKVVYSGSEAALIEAFRAAEANKTWLIGYFYEPQWFLAEVPLKKVALPPYEAGCDADPEAVDCDYPLYTLDKIVSKKFADTGGKLYDLVKNFSWTNDDQNSVSASINEGKSHDEAAKIWVDANEAKWKAWIGQ
jgi:glycine betaine/proline transport system substrate-binding protein